MPKHWLFKSEPDTYSIDDLARDGKTVWEGVRNYQARNLLRDEIKVGDLVFFYHSQQKPPAIVGVAEVITDGYPDPAQFDHRNTYYDPDANPDSPRWYRVDIRFKEKLPRAVSLDELKEVSGLDDMVLLKRSRLSVQPVTPAQWQTILALARG